MSRSLVLPLFVLAAACGDSSPAAPDAGDPDAASDPLPVTVEVLRADRGGSPDQGVTLLFHDAGGALIGRAAADGSGQVERDLPAGSSVTAVQAIGGQRLLTTIADVQPGDHLRIAPRWPVPEEIDEPSRSPRTIRIVAPAYPGATRYQASTACSRYDESRPVPSVPITIDRVCASDDRVDAVMVADGGGSRPLAFTRRIAAPLPGPDGELEITADYVAVATVRGSVRGADQVTILHVGSGDRVLLRARSDATEPGDPWYAPELAYRTVVVAEGGTSTRYVRTQDGRPTDFTADLTTLPELSGLAPSVEGRGLRWPLRGGGDYDGLLATLTWGEEASPHTWRFVLPPGTVATLVPELPPDLDALAPPGADGARLGVRAYDLASLAGWDDLRRDGHNDAEILLAPTVAPHGTEGAVSSSGLF
jgi:hypothetical protein